ncbi:MAG: Gfo/Idh/MocA family oxidoreductase [Schleiferiaceae bacterium]|nr:Gfo/Idh/MocA family oxidoreductase [Schleiferiaceae bacterium]
MNAPKTFALIGAAGYIAPRHMKAIKETSNTLVAAYDPHDCVGILDQFFPATAFFTEFERFDRHIEKLRYQQSDLDYVSICSPNYLHDAHIRFGLRAGAHVICEKPTVLNPWNLDALQQLESEMQGAVYNVLQLRLHPQIIALKKRVESAASTEVFDIDLTYLTSRGNWYFASWKGDEQKSGGVASNIGVHFFDMLQWIFGPVQQSIVHQHSHDRAAGFLVLQRARVRWFLSIDPNVLQYSPAKPQQTVYRSLQINNEAFDFSDGFTDLHTLSYASILKGKGFALSDVRLAIELVHQIRTSQVSPISGDYHPMVKCPQSPHPFSRMSK